jgi:hypothetical protein
MYWRRRVIVVGVPLLIVGLVAYSCSGGGPSKPLGKAATSSTPTPPTTTGIISPSAVSTGSAPPEQSYPTGPPVSGTPAVTGGAGTGGGAGGVAAGNPLSGGAAAAIGGGSGCVLLITVHLNRTSPSGPVIYVSGQYPTFAVSVQDAGAANCRIDASGKGVVVTVTPAGSATAAWSSAVCSTVADIRELGPGDGYNESIVWPRYQSDSSCPTTNRPTVGPGTYAVAASADGVSSGSTQFILD